MKNMVCVDFVTNGIGVNDNWYHFDSFSIDIIENVLPENAQGDENGSINYIVWYLNDPLQTCFSFTNGATILFDNTEENYNKYIKPYADMWQEKYDAEQEEQEQIQQEYNKFENRQARALVQLNQDFETAAQRAHVKSSLGFEVDANSTANGNVNGLLVTIGTGTVDFCDYYNQFHELNKAQLETLQSEIIQNGQSLYAQKWQYRTAIENCTDNEGLDAIVATIEFTYMDFSTAS